MLFFALCLATAAVAHPGQHDQLLQLDRHLQQQPTDQSLYIQRGMLYSESGQYPEAMADFRQAQALGPAELVAFELGVLHYRMGEYKPASSYLKAYLQRFPNFPPAYEYLARIARESGNIDEAIANLEIYFRLQESPNPGLYLSAAKMLEDNGRYDQALHFLDMGMATLGVLPQLQRYAIGIELEQQRPAQAVVRLETLRQILRDSPDWKLEMASLLVLLDRLDDARSLALQAQVQLSELRPTPARIALQAQAAQLISSLKPQPPIAPTNPPVEASL